MADERSDILIVDDDDDTCEVFHDVLTDIGYQVDCARSGAEAFELTGRKSYRLALLDFRLGGTTGVDLFARLRQVHHGLAGILISAFLTSEAEAGARASGILQVLSKPVDMLSLLPLIQEILGRM